MTLPNAQAGMYNYGDQVQTSIHGRRLGLDVNGFSIGGPGAREGIEYWTAGSTGTGIASTAILAPGGISVIETSTAANFVLPGPAANLIGVNKTIQFAMSSGAGAAEITVASGNIQTSVSAGYSNITMTPAAGAVNGSVCLQCISTSAWALNGSTGAAGSGSTHIAFS